MTFYLKNKLECYAKSTSTTLTDYDAKCVYYPADILPHRDSVTGLPSVLPVNLSKYRLHYNPTRENNDMGASDQQVIFIDEDESNLNEQLSDTSSFCEEVEVKF